MSLSTFFVAVTVCAFTVGKASIVPGGTFTTKHVATDLHSSCLISLTRAAGAIGTAPTTNNDMIYGSNVFNHLTLSAVDSTNTGTLIPDASIHMVHVHCPGVTAAQAALAASPVNVAVCTYQKCASVRVQKNALGQVFHLEPASCVAVGATMACPNQAAAPTPQPQPATCLDKWVDIGKKCPHPDFEARDNPENIQCPTGTCTQALCCQPRVHCGTALCTEGNAPWTLRANADDIECPATGCDAATCCNFISFLEAKAKYKSSTVYKGLLATAKASGHFNAYPWPETFTPSASSKWVSPVGSRRRLLEGEDME